MTLKLPPRDIQTIWNRKWRLQHFYRIRSEGRGLVHLNFNDIQDELFAHAEKTGFRRMRDIILKARKEGVTTFYAIMYLDDTLFTPNTTSTIVAHTQDDVKKIFKIVKLAYNHCPDSFAMSDGKIWRKPKANYDNVNELTFSGINSTIHVALQGRGGTINNLHISEASKIPENAVDERMAAIMESVPNIDFGSNITIESTANGMGGWFHDMWTLAENGESEFNPIFFSWLHKSDNRLKAPKGWKPKEMTNGVRAKAMQHFDVELTRDQLFWWEQRKQRQRHLMEQEHPTVPGDAFLSSDVQIFDGEKLRDLKPDEIIAERKGWKIYQEPKPDRYYVIGADPAEGVKGDRSAGVVVDALTLKDVAVYYDNKTSPKEFANKLAYIGKRYNMALIAPERNNHGHAVLQRLKEIYDNIYTERVFDQKKSKKTSKLGWHTNTRTRDLIIDKLVEYFDDGTFEPSSAIIKNEMTTFVTNDKGKREARSGKHDDMIMATAIALQVATMPKRSFGVYSID